MQLKDLYLKDISRHIDGVIKADDESNIAQEVEEYVITREINQLLDRFFKVYSGSMQSQRPFLDIGVWISGYFGCGKSHLLKMLSYILENREIDGRKVGEIFLDKVDQEDFELRSNLEKTLNIPAQTVLFNIDQKSDITSKDQPDAVLSVFIKVFNELQGYYPKFGFIAEFERHLDKQNILGDFKAEYQKLSGISWERGREEYLLESKNIDKALSIVKNVDESTVNNIIERYEEKYSSISIEEFALHVKEYIDNQVDNSRLIFCVDEMGQYISDDTKLMLNLQTISSTLSTKCQGKAWIIVTSQEDLDTVVGDMNARQANDFSRIQARFKTRLNLSSRNVDEVIEKRLLAKKPEHYSLLDDIYHKEKNNLKTLYHFSEGSRSYQHYRSEDHFRNLCPFIPYQFDLFQSSIRGLSKHNAFLGRHLSVGERSMLDVFQEVAKDLADCEVGKMVAYDKLFDGLRATFRSEVQSSIINAERNLSNLFDVRVLKALFLVKYVREFQATVHNIAILMIDEIETSLTDLEKRVKESLNRLVNQTYINQISGVYEFLTDEEKDIESEIKTTEIEGAYVYKFLSEIIFSEIIRDRKIRNQNNNQDYEFTRKMDYRLFGREVELSLHFITPLVDREVSESLLKSDSMGRRELIIRLDEDPNLEVELSLYKKTEKYIQQAHSVTLNEQKRRILMDKSSQNTERRYNLIARVNDLIASATFYLNGSEIDVGAGEAKTKVVNAFQDLLETAYPNLKMLKTRYTENKMKEILFQQGDDLFQGADETLDEDEHEILNYIQRQKKLHERVTTKTLIEHFSKGSYGWYYAAVICLIARLFMRNKVELSHNSNILEKKSVYSILMNNREFDNTIIDPVMDIDLAKIKAVKDFYRDFFDETLAENEAIPVSRSFFVKMNNEIEELENWLKQKHQYPFLKEIETVLDKMKEISLKNRNWLFNNLGECVDDLLDAKENILDPIKRFLKGEQRRIFDNITDFLKNQEANLNYIDNDNLKIVKYPVQSDKPYTGNTIREAKAALETVKKDIDTRIREEREKALQAIEEIKDKVENIEDFKRLDKSGQEAILHPISQYVQHIQTEKFIPVLKDITNQVQDRIYTQALDKISELTEVSEPKGDHKPKPRKKAVSLRTIKPGYYKTVIDSEEDVNEYVKALKKRLLEEIRQNHRVCL